MTWILLGLAIVTEVIGTTSLRIAARGKRFWYLPTFIAYLASFVMLALTLERLSIGVAYAIWAAAGVALTAVVGRLVFHEKISRRTAAGIAAIIAGVLLIELGNPGR